MAEVYRRPKGCPQATGRDPLAWVISKHVDVQAHLETVAMYRGDIAKQILAQHSDTGAAHITIEHGDVDWYVVLHDVEDKYGAKNAMAIETGASGGRGGVHALGYAFPETRVLEL